MSTPPNREAHSCFSSQKEKSAGGHSHLYNSLRPYLDNQSRAQPIIGLNSITEVLTHNQPAIYLCDVCFLRITKADIRSHIMGSIHKYNYTKSHYEHGWRSDTDLTLLARHLMEMAKMVEKKEGTGDIQVLCVDEVVYKRITSALLPDAFAQMKAIKNQQNLNAHFYNSLKSEGNEDNAECQQMSWNMDGTAHYSAARCLLPTSHAFTISSTSKRSVDDEPLTTSTTPRPNALLPSVKPMSSPSQSLAESHVLPSIPFLGSLISQHGNQDQPAIPHSKQSFQGYTVSSEKQCLTRVWSLSTVRPPTLWNPVGAPCQNYMVYSGEENRNKVMQTFGNQTSKHALRLGQTTPYETPSLPINQMAPEITQDQWHGYFGNRSSPAGQYPGCYMEMNSLIKPPEGLEPALTYPNQSDDQAYSQDPVNINWDTHVEAPSDHFSKESNFVFSPNPIAQFAGNDQDSSEVDCVEDYKGPKPVIGLQAVIKCLHNNGNPVSYFYLCQLCSFKLKKKKKKQQKMIRHLTSPEHQRNYLKIYHPELLPKKPKPNLTVQMLEKITHKLEKKEGRGQMKVMTFPAALFNQMLNEDYKSCLHVVLYRSGMERRSDAFSFMKANDKTAGPSLPLKHPAGSISTKWPVEAPIQQVSKKKKKNNPNEVKETVFKVSLSLQEGPPIVIERKPLKDKTSVAPEIETQNPELHMCVHRCPHTVHCTTQQYPGADEQIGDPTLTCSDSDEQVKSPAQFDHSEQLDGQTDEDCGSEDKELTVECADWPGQGNWVFMNKEWQNGEEPVPPEYAGYMQYS